MIFDFIISTSIKAGGSRSQEHKKKKIKEKQQQASEMLMTGTSNVHAIENSALMLVKFVSQRNSGTVI